MAESLKKNYSKRVIFLHGEQRQFLLKALQNLNLSWLLFAEKIGVHRRTLNDWKREEYSIPLDVVQKISKIGKVKMPKKVKVKEPFWYVYEGAKIGGKMGALACFKKYGSYGGDPEYRKKKWYEWWETKGRFINRQGLFRKKIINKPFKSVDLAEFVGIMLGDGGITSRQICITLHREDDKKYIRFVRQIIKKLFKVQPSISKHSNPAVLKIMVSSTDLIDFLVGLDLKKGNKIKQQVDIPDWIKRNRRYGIACVRGLIDTDGCIFNHKYKVHGKWYSYKKLSFRSYSRPLFKSVHKILRSIGLKPRVATENDLRVDSTNDMRIYFQIVGSHNPKHLKRYRN